MRDVRATLYLLWGGALFVLLIGAGLLLASFRRVLAYLVTERTKEIGIRIAFGGTRSGIVQLVLREGLLLIAAGIVFGVAGAAALGRSLESQLFGVRTTDPIAFHFSGSRTRSRPHGWATPSAWSTSATGINCPM